MSSIPLTEIARHHKQFPGEFCSASAHEFIMKLHGRVQLGEFPLQSDPENEDKGFDFQDFLASYGFAEQQQNLDRPSTMKVIAQETANGKYPLLSRPVSETKCHILVAMKDGTELIVVDPADGKIVANSTQATEQLMDSAIQRVPGRDKLHLLTYKDAGPTEESKSSPLRP